MMLNVGKVHKTRKNFKNRHVIQPSPLHHLVVATLFTLRLFSANFQDIGTLDNDEDH